MQDEPRGALSRTPPGSGSLSLQFTAAWGRAEMNPNISSPQRKGEERKQRPGRVKALCFPS